MKGYLVLRPLFTKCRSSQKREKCKSRENFSSFIEINLVPDIGRVFFKLAERESAEKTKQNVLCFVYLLDGPKNGFQTEVLIGLVCEQLLVCWCPTGGSEEIQEEISVKRTRWQMKIKHVDYM